MKKIFSRKFVAVNLKGESYTIGDLAQLMEDYGLHRFFKTFGFNHGKITYHPRTSFVSFLTLNNVWAAARYEAQYEFVITDGFGRQYCPAYLLEQLFLEQPKRAKNLWANSIYYNSNTFGFKSCKQWYINKHSERRSPNTKNIFVKDQILNEEGVKGIRKLKNYYVCPYEGNLYRVKQKSWKKHRRTQCK